MEQRTTRKPMISEIDTKYDFKMKANKSRHHQGESKAPVKHGIKLNESLHPKCADHYNSIGTHTTLGLLENHNIMMKKLCVLEFEAIQMAASIILKIYLCSDQRDLYDMVQCISKGKCPDKILGHETGSRAFRDG